MFRTVACPYFQKAMLGCIPIGALAGLIGLGGGEFRLPLLMHVIGFRAKEAIPLNLLVSLVTLTVALLSRNHFEPIAGIAPHLTEVFGLAAGGMVSAFCGAKIVHAMSGRRLVQLVGCLLAALGGLLVVEAFFPFETLGIVGDSAGMRLLAGAAVGLGVGLVSSVLGVAGGELLIPALMFLFGAEIKTAGTAALLISLALVTTGVGRYWRMGAIPRGRGVQRLVGAMSIGSILGAIAGGMVIAYAPADVLKVALGMVLLAASGKTIFGGARAH